MSLELSVDSVELVNETDVRVTATVTAPDQDTHQQYSGSASTANVPAPDSIGISGSVPPGRPDTFVVVLGTGYSEDDLPAEAFVTVAIEDGDDLFQEQMVVELDADGGFPWTEAAVGVAGAGALVFGVDRLRRFAGGRN